MFGDGDNVMELAQRAALVARHFLGFQPIDKTLCWIRFRRCHALPKRGFHIVLEKNGRRVKVLREVPRCREKIADRYIEFVFPQPRGYDPLYGGVREFTHGKWNRLKQAAKELGKRTRSVR